MDKNLELIFECLILSDRAGELSRDDLYRLPHRRRRAVKCAVIIAGLLKSPEEVGGGSMTAGGNIK